MQATNALTFDPAAVEVWLRAPSDQFENRTRADSLGVNDPLFGRGIEGFLPTIAAVLAAWPDGLHRWGDVTGVLLWRIPDADTLDRGALITVDLTGGIRLCSELQDLKYFSDRGARGVPAMLSALDRIARQVCLLVETYEAVNPQFRAGWDSNVAMIGSATIPGPLQPVAAAFTEQQVAHALNTATDDITDVLKTGREVVADALNLLVNAAIEYLAGRARTLQDVVAQAYSEDYETVLGWIEAATR